MGAKSKSDESDIELQASSTESSTQGYVSPVARAIAEALLQSALKHAPGQVKGPQGGDEV